MIQKTANQLWKESKTTLSFKNWLNREKTKFLNYEGSGNIIVNKPLNDTIESTIGDIRREVGYKQKSDRKKTFGVSKWVLITIALVGVGFVTYKILNKKK
jgi:hypothetical protein